VAPSSEPISRTGVQHLVLETTDADEIVKARTYVRRSNVAVTLLVFGFALQVVSNWV
jgi:hypothetical protein